MSLSGENSMVVEVEVVLEEVAMVARVEVAMVARVAPLVQATLLTQAPTKVLTVGMQVQAVVTKNQTLGTQALTLGRQVALTLGRQVVLTLGRANPQTQDRQRPLGHQNP